MDDVDFDIKALMWDNGQARTVRPKGMFLLDVGTGRILKYGIKAADMRVEDEGNSKAGTKRSLNTDDAKYLFLQAIEEIGLPDYPVHLLLENATADFSVSDKKAFAALMAGRIEIENTGMIKGKILKSGFKQEGGMPWQKGWVESWFRGLHTRINHLPGTIGRRYDVTKGDHAAKEAYAVATVKKALERGIDPSTLELRVLSFDQFKLILDEYVQRINWRCNHKLQGFDRVFEYEIEPGDFIGFDDPQRSSLIPVGATMIERMEAPQERWDRLCETVTFTIPKPQELIPLYLNRRKVKVRHERIQFTDKKFSVDQLVYRDQDSRALLADLNGREVMAFIRDDLELIHLTDLEYGYLGTVGRQRRVDLTDDRAMQLKIREVARNRETVRAEARQIAAPLEEKLAADRAHNDALLGEEMATADKRIGRKRDKQTDIEKQIAAAEDIDISDAFGPSDHDEAEDLSGYYG